jgi:hypothetical protein
MYYEIRVISWSNLWVYGCLLAGIAGLNLTGGMNFETIIKDMPWVTSQQVS